MTWPYDFELVRDSEGLPTRISVVRREGPLASVATPLPAPSCHGPGCSKPLTGRRVRFCSGACRTARWEAEHPRMALLPFEEAQKEKGKALAAGKNDAILARFRAIAEDLFFSGNTVSIEDVRREAGYLQLAYTPGNWMGSVFSDGNWVPAGFAKATHKGSRGRMVRTWVRK